VRCRKLNLPVRQDISLFSSDFRRLFAKLLLRNWDEGGVRATKRNEFTFFSQPPFSFPRKELEHTLLVTRISFGRIVKQLHKENIIKLTCILFTDIIISIQN